MHDAQKRTSRSFVWYGVVGGLVVTVVILAYAVFQMDAKLESLVAQGATEIRQPATENSDTSNAVDDPATWSMLDQPIHADNWDPFHEMEAMHRRIDSLFNDAFGRFNQSDRFERFFGGIPHSPRLDLTDEGDRYVARLDIPGSNDSEISVSVDGQTLIVEGTTATRQDEKAGSGQVLREERRVGKFRRQIQLPEPIDLAKKVETDYEDGVFTVTVYKAKQDPNAS